MLSGVGELMCLGTIVDLAIEVYLFLYQGKTAVSRLGSARDQLDFFIEYEGLPQSRPDYSLRQRLSRNSSPVRTTVKQ